MLAKMRCVQKKAPGRVAAGYGRGLALESTTIAKDASLNVQPGKSPAARRGPHLYSANLRNYPPLALTLGSERHDQCIDKPGPSGQAEHWRQDQNCGWASFIMLPDDSEAESPGQLHLDTTSIYATQLRELIINGCRWQNLD